MEKGWGDMNETVSLRKLALFFSLAIALCLTPLTAFADDDSPSGNGPAASLTVGGSTTEYATIEEAVAAANDTNKVCTLTLLSNLEKTLGDGEHWITLPGTGYLTFDLNGHALEAKGGNAVIYIAQGRHDPITIKDSSATKTGKVSGGQYSIYHQGGDNVIIESGTYQSFARVGEGSLIVKGGTFESYALSNSGDLDSQNGSAKLVLNGGTFKLGLTFAGNSYQTVYEILGSGKTYSVGNQIWPRTEVQKLGNVYDFMKGSCVTVVEESDVVATYTNSSSSLSTPETMGFASLSAAIAYATGKGAGSEGCVTLLKDTDEDIEITNDVHVDFNGKTASGIFAFDGGEIYVEGAFREGSTLRVKKAAYPDESSPDGVVLWNPGAYGLTTEDLRPIDTGVKVRALGGGLALIHEHEWSYVLEDTQSGQMISASCKHPASCPYAGYSDALGAWVELKDTERRYSGFECSASLSIHTNAYLYKDAVPDGDDVVYYDASGAQLAGMPVDAGSYTAKLTFGNETAEAKLTVNPKPVDVTADDKQKTYGDADPALTYAVSAETPLCGEDSLTGALTREAGEDAGEYAIGQGTLTDESNPNYAISFKAGKLSIDPKGITVTAEDQAIAYGESISGTKITAAGLVDGHSVTATLTPNTDNVTASGTIEASDAVIMANGVDVTDSYNVSYASGKLVIKPDTSKIDGLTEANVTSANEADIKAVQEMMASAEMDGADEAARAEWAAITANCKALIDAIDAAADATDTENVGKVENVTPENVALDNKTDLENAKADLERALAENSGNYTEEEKKAIEDEIKRLDDALDVIDDVEEVESLIAKLPKDVTEDDEAAVKAADEAYNALSDHGKSLVSEDAEKTLEEAKAALAKAKKAGEDAIASTGDDSPAPLLALAMLIGATAALLASRRMRRAA